MGIVQLPFPPKKNTPKRVLGRSHRKTRLSAEVWFASLVLDPVMCSLAVSSTAMTAMLRSKSGWHDALHS